MASQRLQNTYPQDVQDLEKLAIPVKSHIDPHGDPKWNVRLQVGGACVDPLIGRCMLTVSSPDTQAEWRQWAAMLMVSSGSSGKLDQSMTKGCQSFHSQA